MFFVFLLEKFFLFILLLLYISYIQLRNMESLYAYMKMIKVNVKICCHYEEGCNSGDFLMKSTSRDYHDSLSFVSYMTISFLESFIWSLLSFHSLSTLTTSLYSVLDQHGVYFLLVLSARYISRSFLDCKGVLHPDPWFRMLSDRYAFLVWWWSERYSDLLSLE